MVEAALLCLALAMYHEARSEGGTAMLAVGTVVLNRAEGGDPRWPREVCAVVRQGGERPLHRCQFSWWCDGRPDAPREARAWREARLLAGVLLEGYRSRALERATCFVADGARLRPWVREDRLVARIGKKSFYEC